MRATDAAGAYSEQSFTVTVNNTNDAPTVSSTATTSIDEDSTYSYTFTTNDIDVGDTVTLAAPNKPSWLSFDAATGVLSGTPSNDDVGDHSIVLTATDAAGAVVTQSFTLAVSNTNDAPTVANAIEYKTALVDTAVSFQLAANTFDDIDVADTLTYAASLSNGEPLPAWLSFNADSRTFSGTPTSNHLGSIDVTVTATDESFAVASDTFTMTVSGSPDIKRFSFGFKEEGGNLKRDILVEMSDNFSQLNEVSILYWKIGDQQSWITLTRDENGLFTNTETVNRYLASGTYQVRALNATDDKGAVLAFDGTQIEDFGFDTIFELSNSLSDEIAPTIDSFSIGEFYYDEVNEVWKIDHTIKISDNLSGIHPVYNFTLGNLSGPFIGTQGAVNENGEATGTRELPKYWPGGDYTLDWIRIYDLAGNNGSISGSQAAALAGKQYIKLENEFADNLAPTLTSFNLRAELNQSTGRPSVILDFLANDTGGSGYTNSYAILLNPNGEENFNGWVDRDISEETGVQFKIDLPTEYVAGIFSVNYFKVRDNAANETQYTKSDLANLGFDSEINIYFAPENPGDNYIIEAMSGENWLIGTNLSDIFDGGSDKDIFIGGSGEDKFLFDINDFHSSVEQADVISDFTVGEDIIGLKDGLSFNELSIAQGSGEYASDTIISKKSDGEYLAILQAVDASLLDEAYFTPVDIA